MASTSAPAMKMRGLAESSTRQPTSSRRASSVTRRSSSATTSRVKMLALRPGRSKVSVARRSGPTSRRKASGTGHPLTGQLPHRGKSLSRVVLAVHPVDDFGVLLVHHPALDLLRGGELAGLERE